MRSEPAARAAAPSALGSPCWAKTHHRLSIKPCDRFNFGQKRFRRQGGEKIGGLRLQLPVVFRCVIRETDPVMRAISVASRRAQTANSQARLNFAAGGIDKMRLDDNVVARGKFGEHLRGEVRIGVVELVEIFNNMQGTGFHASGWRGRSGGRVLPDWSPCRQCGE